MSTFLVFAGVVIIGLFMVLQLWMSADFFGIFLARIGNPILKKLGLQGDATPGSEFIGKKAKVLENDGTSIRVEFDGTTWKAESLDTNWVPAIGESVCIDGLDGLTLQISKIVSIN